MGDLTRNGEFRWPSPNSIELLELNSRQCLNMGNGDDFIEWKTSGAHKFIVRDVWEATRVRYQSLGQIYLELPEYSEV